MAPPSIKSDKKFGGSMYIRHLVYTQEWESWFTLGPNATKTIDYFEKWFERNLCKIKFPTKKLCGSIFLAAPGVELEGSKDMPCLKCYNTLEWVCRFTFVLNAEKKYDLYRKMVQTKVVENLISYKKLESSISLSTPRVELWSFKDVSCLQYYNTLEWKSRFTLGPNAAKKYWLYGSFKQKSAQI